MKKLLLFVLLPLAVVGQRTQIGKDIAPPTESGMQLAPLFYVDTSTNSYYERASKNAAWVYKLHERVVHDTIIVRDTITIVKDTLYQIMPNSEFLFPEDYGATNAVGDADAIAWQKCIDEAAKTGKQVYGSGKKYFINKTLNIPLNVKDGFYINGNYSTITLSGSNGLFKRENPADNNIANIYIRTILIEKFVVQGNGKNTVIDMNSTFGLSVQHFSVNNVHTFGYFRFCLQGLMNNVRVSNYKKLAVVTVGNWKGTSRGDGTSGSNSFSITNCRGWGTADTIITVDGSSGFNGLNNIMEGDKATIGYLFDSEGVTTAKDFRVRNQTFSTKDTTSFTGTHFENRSGLENALFVIKGIDYVVVIDGVFGQYAALLCDGSSTSGSGHITIQNIPFWLPLNGKMFKGNKNKPCSYAIVDCNVPAMRNNFPSLFIGDAPSLCNAPPNCGYFKYVQRYIPR